MAEHHLLYEQLSQNKNLSNVNSLMIISVTRMHYKPLTLNSIYYLLLTYSMVQSPSWEANWFAASQEIPHISWNPKDHYCTHKRPPQILYIKFVK